GHQFGNWANQLGDGRAITLGELEAPGGASYELQLKGAGPTPYSRTADGRAVLRSSIRELLQSEAMHHLGVPTTRALSLIGTGEPVLRDMFYDGRARHEPGAVVCRVAPSFLRFGNFEILAARQDLDLLERLVDHTVTRLFPELGPPGRDATLALLAEIARRTAVMVAHWMRVGFVHGVMNTDNMSVLGLTIDYGPYGFLDVYDPDWTPNTTDAGGRRYRFANQPQIALWNLVRFANALYPLIGEAAPLEEALSAYASTFAVTHEAMMADKLGLVAFDPDRDVALAQDLDRLLRRVETDMTIFHRQLAAVPTAPDAADAALLAPLADAFYETSRPADHDEALLDWLRRWGARVRADGRPDAERVAAMNRANPRFVLRNYLAQEAIDLAEAGDPSRILELLDLMRRPYDEQPGRERFAARRPEWARHKAGCSALSCSS
ncbi:MAG: YdiU family protein, partial [Myxococcales bacterium]|nr:YdiU family protein [Myxococcales bacterium]